MSQRKTLSKVPLTPQFTTNGLSYADVVKFDKSNHVHASVTNIPVIDHSNSKGDHRYADVVTFGDKHQNKNVGDHSCAGKWCSS